MDGLYFRLPNETMLMQTWKHGSRGGERTIREENEKRKARIAILTIATVAFGLAGVHAGEKPPDLDDPRY